MDALTTWPQVDQFLQYTSLQNSDMNQWFNRA